MRKILQTIQRLYRFCIDILFPKECVGCKNEGAWLCDSCREQLEYSEKQECFNCRKQHILGKTCEDCQDTALDVVIVTYPYENKSIQDLVKLLKYSYVEEIGSILGTLVSQYINQLHLFELLKIEKENIYITSVPLHKKRFLERGFNQCDSIGSELAQHSNCIFTTTIVQRIKNTTAQATLGKQKRMMNMQGAFSLHKQAPPIQGKTIILIDDVLTTGSTLNECAKVLKENGAEKVIGIVIARN